MSPLFENSKRPRSISLFSPCLGLVMPLLVLPSTSMTLPVVRAHRVHVSTSLRRSWLGLTRTPPVYWLTGLAGLGKTAIAYTICGLLNEAHMPLASFFCSLQLDSRNSKLLVTTLCRDLAELYDSYVANVQSPGSTCLYWQTSRIPITIQ
jgi:hypothetical protein